MAQGPLGSIPTLRDALPALDEAVKGGEITTTEVKSKKDGEAEEIKVLSWNIWGGNVEEKKDGKSKSSKGDVKTETEKIEVKSRGRTSSARHAIVSKVVEEINPDILLLQETKTKILVKEIVVVNKVDPDIRQPQETTDIPVEEIEKLNSRDYKQVAQIREEGAKKTSWKEAKVLYDSNKFEATYLEQRTNELGLALKTIPEATANVSLREKEGGKPREAGVGNVIKERVSWVRLKKKNDPNAGREIIFMSFHNYYTTESDNGARVFCKAVAEMKSRTGVDVVAGADFNCEFDKDKVEENSKEWKEQIHIPNYTMSTRRRSKIDYIITAQKTPDVRVEAREPWDIATSRLEGRVVVDSEGERHTFSADDYHKTVDHDPLICTLTLQPKTMPPN